MGTQCLPKKNMKNNNIKQNDKLNDVLSKRSDELIEKNKSLNEKINLLLIDEIGISLLNEEKDSNLKLKDIIDDLIEKKKDKEDINYFLSNKFSLKNDRDEEIDTNKTLKELLINPNDKTLRIRVFIVGLKNLTSDYSQYILKETNFFGKFYSNPFQLYIYDKKLEVFKKAKFDRNNKYISKISLIASSSVYCTGIDKIFIFGGEEDNKITNSFWIIHLSDYPSIKLIPNNLNPRKYHSMIYIPKDYIFIVGGENIYEVILFYNSTSNFIKYGEIPEELIEPGLSYINEKYLYVFSNLKSLSIYRKNLRDKIEIKWEKIHFKFHDKVKSIKQKFFGVCDNNNSNEIYFIGGDYFDLNDNKTSINFFNYQNNLIGESQIDCLKYTFAEKHFIPFDENKCYQILNCPRESIKLILYNKITNLIEKKSFKTNSEKNIELLSDRSLSTYHKFNLNYPSFTAVSVSFFSKNFSDIPSIIKNKLSFSKEQYSNDPSNLKQTISYCYVNRPKIGELFSSSNFNSRISKKNIGNNYDCEPSNTNNQDKDGKS